MIPHPDSGMRVALTLDELSEGMIVYSYDEVTRFAERYEVLSFEKYLGTAKLKNCNTNVVLNRYPQTLYRKPEEASHFHYARENHSVHEFRDSLDTPEKVLNELLSHYLPQSRGIDVRLKEEMVKKVAELKKLLKEKR